jgi:hypothetical protein
LKNPKKEGAWRHFLKVERSVLDFGKLSANKFSNFFWDSLFRLSPALYSFGNQEFWSSENKKRSRFRN